jgi:hypothetical protein
MGDESTLYRERLVDGQSTVAAYARYAINMVVGSLMFDLLDRDKSGLILHSELFHELKYLLGDRLDDAVRFLSAVLCFMPISSPLPQAPSAVGFTARLRAPGGGRCQVPQL